MKTIFNKFDQLKLGHKLHQLQKRYNRAESNGYTDKMADYARRIDELQVKLRNIKGHKNNDL